MAAVRRSRALRVDAVLARLVVLACAALAVGAMLLPLRGGAAGMADGECIEVQARAAGEPVVWNTP